MKLLLALSNLALFLAQKFAQLSSRLEDLASPMPMSIQEIPCNCEDDPAECQHYILRPVAISHIGR